MSPDESLMLWINQDWSHPFLDLFLSWVSTRLYFSFPLLMLFFAYCVHRGGRIGIRLSLALLLVIVFGDALGNQLKDLFAAPRPCYVMFESLIKVGSPVPVQCGAELTGMPSNHALNFTAAAVFVTFATRWRSWKLLLWMVAVLAGLSRIYLGKHFPSQVLAGMGFGAAIGLLGAWIACRCGCSPLGRYTSLSSAVRLD